jgi:capsular exopolysaccharide synthesis family protein
MLQEIAPERPQVCTSNGVTNRSALSAQYDALLRRIQIEHTSPATGQTIGVVSCEAGAGVSTVAFNVALTAARSGGSVLFIDADISKPPGKHLLDATPASGLIDVLADAAEALDCVEPTRYENLSVVAGRGASQSSVSNVSPAKFGELLNEYRRHFNIVVVDIPAPTQANDNVAVAGQLDGVVLVIEAERADGRVALWLKQQLENAGANLLGVVLNKRRQYVPGWLYRRL